MSNDIKCGQCVLYAEQLKPQPEDRPAKSLHRGHCLDRTIYAVNKPGSPVYPPGAKTAELPNGRHKIAGVREDQLVPNCTAASLK
jgi:hypothetical protein